MLSLSQKLLSSVLMLSVFQANYSEALEISSYARVSKNGDSISIQSDKGNKSNEHIPTKVSDIDSALIDKHNTTGKLLSTEREAKQMSDKSSSEKSTGRAIQSNYYFPLPQMLTKPVRSNSYNSDKTGRLIVYPSYVGANNIDRTKTRYNMKSPTSQRTAQRRFQYTPDKLYKFKGGENSQGYQYSQPPTDSNPAQASPPPSIKFTAPIVVADMTSGPSSPPKSSYLPADMMPSSPPKSSYLPPSAPGSQFLPTVLPEESTSINPVQDLLSFPSHVNSSYIPNELDAIKNSIDINHQSDAEPATDETTYTPPNHLYNFPPNIDSSYLPPEMNPNMQTINKYLPPPTEDSSDNSDDNLETDMPYMPPKDLHNFPPNIESSYLPPSMMKNKDPVSSYLPPPSGDNSDDSESPPSDDDMMLSYTPPNDLHNFPPNVGSSYLPPSTMMRNKNPVNSYIPPPSGVTSDNSNVPPPDDPSLTYIPPKNLHNFPPNIYSSYLPPGMKRPDIPSNSYYPPASGIEAEIPAPASYVYKPPKNLQKFPPNIDSSYLPPEMKQVMLSANSYLPPASGSVSGFDDESKQNLAGPMPPPMDMAMDGPMDMQPPMDMPMDMPPTMDMSSMDDDHHHHHHHDHDFAPWWNSDIIYDDHHHHHHHEETTTTTTEPPPEEPRVKKYSYYYLGRKLWYIPLYFTLWFCLYVVFLIIRSIGRHKVDLPNHYVARSIHDMSHQEITEKIDTLTAFTMQQIEDFKEKYL